MHMYETWFGHGQNMDYDICFLFAGLRSIQGIIIKHVLAAVRHEICKVLYLHICFCKCERASIRSVNVMVFQTNIRCRACSLKLMQLYETHFSHGSTKVYQHGQFVIHSHTFLVGFLLPGCINHAVA